MLKGVFRKADFILMAVLIIIGIAVCHKIQEDIKILQTQRSLLFRDLSSRMRGGIAGLPDIVHARRQRNTSI